MRCSFFAGTRFPNACLQNLLYEWNLLEEDIRHSQTLGEFKSSLLAKKDLIKRQPLLIAKHSLRCETTLRVRFSRINEHRFRHNLETLSQFAYAIQVSTLMKIFHPFPFAYKIRNDFFHQLSEVSRLELGTIIFQCYV